MQKADMPHISNCLFVVVPLEQRLTQYRRPEHRQVHWSCGEICPAKAYARFQ